MRRIGTVLVVVLTVVAGVAVPVVGVQAATSTTGIGGGAVWAQTETADVGNETAAEPAPGTRLAGSVGVQGAELGGELESRSFEHQLRRSNSDASKAQVVAHQAEQSQARLDALRTDLQELEATRENGTVSETAYRVRTAQLSARAAALQRLSKSTSETAGTLPAAALQRHGVNLTELEAVRSGADRLTGPERAAIARSVAGPGAARANGFGQAGNASQEGPARAGPPADAPGRNGNARAENASAPGGPAGAAPGDARAQNETATASDRPNGGESADGANGRDGNRGNGNGDGNHGGNSDGSRGGGNGAADPERSGSGSGPPGG